MRDLGAEQLDCLAKMKQDGGGWSILSSWAIRGNVTTIGVLETLKARGLVEGDDGEYDLTDAGYVAAVERLDDLGSFADTLDRFNRK